MSWRDFQAAPPREFMESMESMTINPPVVSLIPLIPLIPVEPVTETDNKPNLYCSDGGCHCSQKLPGNSCGGCEYLDNPRRPSPTISEIVPATFEQIDDPVSCPYWFQICHWVGAYHPT